MIQIVARTFLTEYYEISSPVRVKVGPLDVPNKSTSYHSMVAGYLMLGTFMMIPSLASITDRDLVGIAKKAVIVTVEPMVFVLQTSYSKRIFDISFSGKIPSPILCEHILRPHSTSLWLSLMLFNNGFLCFFPITATHFYSLHFFAFFVYFRLFDGLPVIFV